MKFLLNLHKTVGTSDSCSKSGQVLLLPIFFTCNSEKHNFKEGTHSTTNLKVAIGQSDQS